MSVDDLYQDVCDGVALLTILKLLCHGEPVVRLQLSAHPVKLCFH